MAKEIMIEFSNEAGEYLQRLGMEVDAKAFLIDYMFANHAQDQDTSMFDSVPFKHYMKEYEQSVTTFNLAKQEFQKEYLDKAIEKAMGKKVAYNWLIDDYKSCKCKVTILD